MSSSELQVAMDPKSIPQATNVQVQVDNPAPAMDTSNALPLQLTASGSGNAIAQVAVPPQPDPNGIPGATYVPGFIGAGSSDSRYLVVAEFILDTCLGVSSCTPSMTPYFKRSDFPDFGHGGPVASLSANARYIAYMPFIYRLAEHIILGDTCTNAPVGCQPTTLATFTGAETSIGPSISADGRYMVFYGLTLYDSCQQAPPGCVPQKLDYAIDNQSVGGLRISGNGRLIVFSKRDSSNNSLLYAIPNCIATGGTCPGMEFAVSVDDSGVVAGASYQPAVSYDGRYIAFVSTAALSADTPLDNKEHLYLRDTCFADGCTPSTRYLLSATAFDSSYVTSRALEISADGRYLVFTTGEPGIVPDDTNGLKDVFVADLCTAVVEPCTTQVKRVSVNADGVQGDADSYNAWISPDGQWIVFSSSADNLVSGSTAANGTTYRLRSPFMAQ